MVIELEGSFHPAPSMVILAFLLNFNPVAHQNLQVDLSDLKILSCLILPTNRDD